MMVKQVKLLTLKQSGEKSVKAFNELINGSLKTIPNSRLITVFMPNINRIYAVIEYDIDEANIKYE